MWRDDDGTMHTVALPDPTEVMSVELVRSLESLSRRERADVRSSVDTMLDEASDDAPGGWLAAISGPPEATPPVGVMAGRVVDGATLRRVVEAVDPVWRLDVLLALEDLLDELETTWWRSILSRLTRGRW